MLDAVDPRAPPAGQALLGARVVALYAVGSFGTGVFSTVPTVLMLYYCTETLSIPAALAAAAVFLPKAWSIFWDPFVGGWSDRARSRFGRRAPFMAIGAVGVFASFIALFSSPSLSPTGALVWVAAAYFSLATLYSLFAVPYIALPAELAGADRERGRLVSWRMTCAMVGVLAGAALAPVIVAHFGGGRHGYAAMAIIIASICAVAMAGPVLAVQGRERPPVLATRGPSTAAALRMAFAFPAFRFLALSYLLQITAIGIFSALTPYLVTRVMVRPEGDIGAAMGALLLTTIVSTPLWAWIAQRLGERMMLSFGALSLAASTAMLGALAYSGAPWVTIIAAYAIIGIPFAALQVLPFMLLADLIHARAQADDRSEALYTGIWTAVEKLALALGPALSGLCIALFGRDLAHGAPIFIAIAPAALALISLAPLALSAQRKSVA